MDDRDLAMAAWFDDIFVLAVILGGIWLLFGSIM